MPLIYRVSGRRAVVTPGWTPEKPYNDYDYGSEGLPPNPDWPGCTLHLAAVEADLHGDGEVHTQRLSVSDVEHLAEDLRACLDPKKRRAALKAVRLEVAQRKRKALAETEW
jgi:hypothetical protein